MMEQPAAATLNDLCTVVRQISLREICRTENYPQDGLIAIKNAVSDHLINAVIFAHRKFFCKSEGNGKTTSEYSSTTARQAKTTI